MIRFTAFLRAINVGGPTVTMECFRGLFAELGLDRVESFLAPLVAPREILQRSTATR